jgi:hypothetical protein
MTYPLVARASIARAVARAIQVLRESKRGARIEIVSR